MRSHDSNQKIISRYAHIHAHARCYSQAPSALRHCFWVVTERQGAPIISIAYFFIIGYLGEVSHPMRGGTPDLPLEAIKNKI